MSEQDHKINAELFAMANIFADREKFIAFTIAMFKELKVEGTEEEMRQAINSSADRHFPRILSMLEGIFEEDYGVFMDFVRSTASQKCMWGGDILSITLGMAASTMAEEAQRVLAGDSIEDAGEKNSALGEERAEELADLFSRLVSPETMN